MAKARKFMGKERVEETHSRYSSFVVAGNVEANTADTDVQHAKKGFEL